MMSSFLLIIGSHLECILLPGECCFYCCCVLHFNSFIAIQTCQYSSNLIHWELNSNSVIISASRAPPRNACKTKPLICLWTVGMAGNDWVCAANVPWMKKRVDIEHFWVKYASITLNSSGMNCLSIQRSYGTACFKQSLNTDPIWPHVIIGLTSLSCFPRLASIMKLFIKTSLWVNIFFCSVSSGNPL